MERKLVWVCDPFIMETEPNLVDCPGLSLQPLLPGEGQRGSPGGAGRPHPSPHQHPSVQEPGQCLQQGQGSDVQVIDKAFSLLSCGTCWRRIASCSLFIVHCSLYLFNIYLFNLFI